VKPRKILSWLALLGQPLLRLFGVRRGTVAEDAVKVIETVDKALPPAPPSSDPH